MSTRSSLKKNSVRFLLPNDWFFVLLVLSLTVFGLVMVGNASVAEAFRDFGDKYYYFKLQSQWTVIGLLAFIFFSFFDYRKLKSLSVPLVIFTLFCLVLVLVPGFGSRVLGARRWLEFGPVRFQPAEMAKLALLIYSASFFSIRKQAAPFLVIVGLMVGLIMLEPDLGTTIVLVASGLMVYFVSGSSLFLFSLTSFFGLLAGLVLILTSPYRRERLLSFLNPAADPLGTSYHVRQALIAIGSGGIFGVGLGQSRQKYQYLPMATTDSIFAVIAEELGFVGALVVILIFLVLVWRCFNIAQKCKDNFGRFLAVGIASWISFQTLVNLGAMVALLPLTGVPLPFVSYGGSSLVLILIAMGIINNISRQNKPAN